jgi:hypothetical protein
MREFDRRGTPWQVPLPLLHIDEEIERGAIEPNASSLTPNRTDCRRSISSSQPWADPART